MKAPTKKEISPIEGSYAYGLENAKRLVISCQKCDLAWIYYEGFNDFNAQMRDVKKHLKTHAQ